MEKREPFIVGDEKLVRYKLALLEAVMFEDDPAICGFMYGGKAKARRR